MLSTRVRVDSVTQVLLEGYKLITRFARTAPLSDYLLESESPKNAETLSEKEIMEHLEKS